MRRKPTERARVHEAPEPGILGAEDGVARAGDDPLESDAENVGDDLEEETGDLDGLGAEVLSRSRKWMRFPKIAQKYVRRARRARRRSKRGQGLGTMS